MISPTAARRLRKSLKDFTLVGPIIVNRRTMHIVGGHQRLDSLDALEGRHDYSVGVTFVDLDAKRERALNVLLNNEQAQGSYDVALLDGVLKEIGDPVLAGFDRLDLEVMFGDDRFGDLFKDPLPDSAVGKTQEEIDRINAEVKAELQAKRAEYSSTPVGEETEYYAVVVFKDVADRERFCVALGAAKDDRYVSWSTVSAGLGLPESVADAADLIEGRRALPAGEAPAADPAA